MVLLFQSKLEGSWSGLFSPAQNKGSDIVSTPPQQSDCVLGRGVARQFARRASDRTIYLSSQPSCYTVSLVQASRCIELNTIKWLIIQQPKKKYYFKFYEKELTSVSSTAKLRFLVPISETLTLPCFQVFRKLYKTLTELLSSRCRVSKRNNRTPAHRNIT